MLFSGAAVLFDDTTARCSWCTAPLVQGSSVYPMINSDQWLVVVLRAIMNLNGKVLNNRQMEKSFTTGKAGHATMSCFKNANEWKWFKSIAYRWEHRQVYPLIEWWQMRQWFYVGLWPMALLLTGFFFHFYFWDNWNFNVKILFGLSSY